jgi:hypothetical protein
MQIDYLCTTGSKRIKHTITSQPFVSSHVAGRAALRFQVVAGSRFQVATPNSHYSTLVKDSKGHPSLILSLADFVNLKPATWNLEPATWNLKPLVRRQN